MQRPRTGLAAWLSQTESAFQSTALSSLDVRKQIELSIPPFCKARRAYTPTRGNPCSLLCEYGSARGGKGAGRLRREMGTAASVESSPTSSTAARQRVRDLTSVPGEPRDSRGRQERRVSAPAVVGDVSRASLGGRRGDCEDEVDLAELEQHRTFERSKSGPAHTNSPCLPPTPHPPPHTASHHLTPPACAY